MYTCRLTPSEFEELSGASRKASELFNALMRERLRAWAALADQRLGPQGLKIHLIFGNDDRFEVDDAIAGYDALVPFEGQAFEMDGYEFVGCGFTNPTPWHTPREVPEDRLKRRLEDAISNAGRMDRTIFVFHCPPVETALDLAPRLTPDLKIVQKAGSIDFMHVGSRSVREVIESHQPFLSLHRHINESRGDERIFGGAPSWCPPRSRRWQARESSIHTRVNPCEGASGRRRQEKATPVEGAGRVNLCLSSCIKLPLI